MTSSHFGRALTATSRWVLGLVLVVLVGGGIALFVLVQNAKERGTRTATDDARLLVEVIRDRLRDATADGDLSEAEVAAFNAHPTEVREVRREPGRVVVTVLVTGTGPGLVVSPGISHSVCSEYEIPLPRTEARVVHQHDVAAC